jgi:hypothetical protein
LRGSPAYDASFPACTPLLVHEKTGGNPFFAIQFLSSLAEEGLLRLDRRAAAWIWDLDAIRAKGYSDNVVDLMLGKLRGLPHQTQSALPAICLSRQRGRYDSAEFGFGAIPREDPRSAVGSRPHRVD